LTLFSAELPVLFYFVQVSGYLGTLEKSQKIILKISVSEASVGPKGDHRAARRVPGAAQPLAAPPALLGGSHTPWCPRWTPIYSPVEETPKEKSLFRSTPRSRRNPLFFPGDLIWRLNWPPIRGKSSPSSSSSPLDHPSFTSSLMCE